MFTDLLNDFFASALGVSYGDLILLIVLAFSIILFAIGFRQGLILMFMILGLTYMVFNQFAIDQFHVLTLFVVIGVIMVVSMLISHSREKSGLVGI
jgi:hypothetical protein